MKKHNLYELYAYKSYRNLLKKSKNIPDLNLHKAIKNSTCWNLPKTFYDFKYLLRAKFLETPVDALIFSMEYLWANISPSKRTVIYPSGTKEIEIISKSSFKNIDLSTMPSDLIIIAMPPESALPPILAGFLNKDNISIADSFIKNQVPHTDVWQSLSTIGLSFSICMQTPDDENSYMMLEISESDLPKYAAAKSAEEILEIMPNGGKGNTQRLTDKEQLIQAKCLKIALNFWLYRIASPESFVKKTPPATAREQYGSTPTATYTLNLPSRTKSSQDGMISEVGIHMRNLRDERFYTTPEWKDKPRGSRWIEVSAHTRGGKGEMIEDDEIEESLPLT